MIKIFFVMAILFIIHGILNIYRNNINFYNWYEPFILIVIDKFIIEGIPSYMSVFVLIYFIIINVIMIRKLNLLKIDNSVVG